MHVAAGEMFRSRRVASFRGVDQARQALTDIFLPVDFPSARASNIIDMKLNALKVGRLTFGHMGFQDAVRVETAEAENYHIDIPTSGRATMRAGLGSPIYGTQQTAGIFMPGRPVTIDCGERFAQLSLMIPRAQLQLEVENLLGDSLARPLEFSAEMDLTSPGAQLMMHAVRIIDEASELEGGPLAHPLAMQRLEQVLMHNLLFAQPHNHSAALTRPSPAAGVRPIARAVELLLSDPAHPWTVTELAAAVSLSVRSLQDGFRRSMDTTPMAYLRRLRLEKVHDELAAAESVSATVTESAARWGFVHLGRFAAAYRREFGERPSDTMRSAARAHRSNN
ncbi:helix-turn-helix domain-containing protein [Leifsonia sp. NPDC058248]|uniref:AraC family transcriptional regulator n=1 Tax=Leifsonia sp. NPDC058248 TaxID=3346402 RepID=UPI0036DCC7DC